MKQWIWPALVSAMVVAGPFAFPGSAARAADMTTIQPVSFNWTGAYVGADVGYFWANVDGGVPAAAVTAPTHPDSVALGGHVGYRYEFPNAVVVGAEADLAWLNGDDYGAFTTLPTQGFRMKTNWSGSIRGVLGYAFQRNLVYATGGWSWLDVKGCGLGNIATPGVCFPNTSFSKATDGWTVGAGISHAFTDHLVGSLEYRYTDYGTFSYAAAGAAGGVATVSAKSNEILARLSWKFGN